IRTAVSRFLDSAQSLSTSEVQVNVAWSSFVDSTGATITSDIAQVHLAGVTLGSSRSFAQAGFWIGRRTSWTRYRAASPDRRATRRGARSFQRQGLPLVLVAETVDPVHHLAVRQHRRDLPADLLDVAVDGPVGDDPLVAVHRVHELLAGIDPA